MCKFEDVLWEHFPQVTAGVHRQGAKAVSLTTSFPL